MSIVAACLKLNCVILYRANNSVGPSRQENSGLIIGVVIHGIALWSIEPPGLGTVTLGVHPEFIRIPDNYFVTAFTGQVQDCKKKG